MCKRKEKESINEAPKQATAVTWSNRWRILGLVIATALLITAFRRLA